MDVFLVVPDFSCYLDADFVRNINTGMLAIRQQAVAPPLDVKRSIRQVKRLVWQLVPYCEILGCRLACAKRPLASKPHECGLLHQHHLTNRCFSGHAKRNSNIRKRVAP